MEKRRNRPMCSEWGSQIIIVLVIRHGYGAVSRWLELVGRVRRYRLGASVTCPRLTRRKHGHSGNAGNGSRDTMTLGLVVVIIIV